eukprot:7019235-Heterocapsa_arctica.AAC.1
MAAPKELPRAAPLMATPQAKQKARSSTPKLPGHVVRRDMGPLRPQHPQQPRLSNRLESRQWSFSAADWNRLAGGGGHHIGITWCDA